MNIRTTIALALLVVLALAGVAQAEREDVIWARTSPTPITLDGILDEPAWAAAETKVVRYGVDNGIPGSGWKLESGWEPQDSTRVTLKFLVYGNQLFMAAQVPDISIGGSTEFNRFDGFLMDIKNHADPGHPKPPTEYLYSWWYPDWTDPLPVGLGPCFRGAFAPNDSAGIRTPEQIAAWDAVTIVDGSTNTDTTLDTGYTVEMKFDLGVIGYDVTQPEGDVIEFNISIYDTDYYWPATVLLFTTNRVWWQDPWGNTGWYGEVRIHARPDVTTTSGTVPDVGPEVTIPNVTAVPTIDGVLDETVWNDGSTYTFDIRWDDDALRLTYDGVGPWRAGQFQPTVNGGQAIVRDPADATVHVYHNGTMLYFGFDVRDGVVQYHPVFDRWDGFIVSLEDIVQLNDVDHVPLARRLSFQVGPDGEALPQDYLPTLINDGMAEVALHLMAGTTVDTLGQQVDNGYSAELAIDLSAFSYPAIPNGERVFFGVDLLDGDSFIPINNSYGTRTWWQQQYENTCCVPWGYLAPGTIGVEDPYDGLTNPFAHSIANPSGDPRLSFALPRASAMTLEVYDVRGRLVSRRPLGVQQSGIVPLFADRRPEAGVYLYRLLLTDAQTGAPLRTLQGKTLLLK